PELKTQKLVTWKELEALAASRKARLGLPVDDWVSEALLVGTLGRPSLEGTESHVDDPRVRELFARLRRMREAGLIELTPDQRKAYDDFTEGSIPLALFSSSAYKSVLARAKFPFRVQMPPYIAIPAVNVGGGDLLAPGHPETPLDNTKARDMAT